MDPRFPQTGRTGLADQPRVGLVWSRYNTTSTLGQSREDPQQSKRLEYQPENPRS